MIKYFVVKSEGVEVECPDAAAALNMLEEHPEYKAVRRTYTLLLEDTISRSDLSHTPVPG